MSSFALPDYYSITTPFGSRLFYKLQFGQHAPCIWFLYSILLLMLMIRGSELSNEAVAELGYFLSSIWEWFIWNIQSFAFCLSYISRECCGIKCLPHFRLKLHFTYLHSNVVYEIRGVTEKNQYSQKQVRVSFEAHCQVVCIRKKWVKALTTTKITTCFHCFMLSRYKCDVMR